MFRLRRRPPRTRSARLPAGRPRGSRSFSFAALGLFALLFLPVGVTGCGGEDVTVYCALDRNFAEPLLRRFEEKTGLKVRALYDVEAVKTVGLVRKIVEEAKSGRVRCDVFWNNEIVNTIKLKQQGLLAPYASPGAKEIPPGFKDPEHYWTGFAARARILAVNTERLPDRSKWPRSYADLAAPAFKGLGGMAKPLAGTTATHGVVLFQKLGKEGAEAFFRKLVESGVEFTAGNAHLMRRVREGKLAFGFTDTDDFNVALRSGYPVEAVYPDQGGGEMGTLVLPNTVAMLAGCPHPEAAKRLIDYLLSPEVEAALARCDSAQIPLHPGVERPEGVKVPGKDFRAMEVDFERAAREFDACQEFFRRLFIR